MRDRLAADWIDAALWFAIPALILSLVPIGFVSGDGLAESAAYARGSWSFNPNHFLFEPLGSWWQAFTASIGLTRPDPDRLKLLSIIAGAATLGVFRWGVAGPLADSRGKANLATLWVALSSAFMRLWISDEVHMIQLPLLAACAAVLVRHARAPRLRTALLAGALGGLAALFYISLVLVPLAAGAIFAAWLFARRESRSALRSVVGIWAGAIAAGGGSLVLAWSQVAPAGVGLLHWLGSYAGGTTSSRLVASLGLELSARGIAVSSARAIYGSLSSVVDIALLVQHIRYGSLFEPGAVLSAVACLCGALVILFALRSAVASRPAGAAKLLVASSIAAATLAFAVYWNNSDDQFYFQLALAAGALVTGLQFRGRHGVLLVTLIAVTLGWNAWDMIRNEILYPRDRNVRLLASRTAGADLIVYPGYDDVAQALFFVRPVPGTERLALTSLANRLPPGEGLDTLRARVARVLGRGGRVDVVSIFDVRPVRSPWRRLAASGYDRTRILGALTDVTPAQVRTTAGPFPVRSLYGLRRARAITRAASSPGDL